MTPIAALPSLPAGTTVLVRGTVARVRIFPRRLLDVFVDEGGMTVRARWFRPPRGMQKSFTKGAPVALAGPLRRIDDGADGAAPAFELVQPSVQRQPAEGQGSAAAGRGHSRALPGDRGSERADPGEDSRRRRRSLR